MDTNTDIQNEMKRCKTCKHWEKRESYYGEVLDADLHMIEETVCHATETLCSTCGNDFRKCVAMTANAKLRRAADEI